MTSSTHKGLPLYGLVLTGGKSVRMGTRKDLISWHGKQQRYHIADLLRTVCEHVYISCRADQLINTDPQYPMLPDTFSGIGPAGGILTALEFRRNAAWLVVACDLPLVDDRTLEILVGSRDSEKIATAYLNPVDGLPEPLIAIWEPKSYGLLLEYLGKNVMCPRKMLIHADTQLITAPDPNWLLNVNTPADAERASSILKT